MPGTSPMTSSESSTGPSDPAAMSPAPILARVGAVMSACTRLALLSAEPSAHRQPVTDSETPATAVDASWVCTSMSGISPATAVKAADTSIRTAMTVGTPRASRAMPWGSARRAPDDDEHRAAADDQGADDPGVRLGEQRRRERRDGQARGEQQRGRDPTALGCRGVGIRGRRTTRVGAAQRRAAAARAPPGRRAGARRRPGASPTGRRWRRPGSGPRSEGRIQAAAKEAKILARRASGRAWATSTIRAVSMSASAAPEAARPTTNTAMVGARPETTWARTKAAIPQSSTGRGPARSVQPPDHAIAMVKVTSVAPVEAPNRAQPSSSRTMVGRIVLTARFSKAARVTSADDADDDRQVRPGEQPYGCLGASAAARQRSQRWARRSPKSSWPHPETSSALEVKSTTVGAWTDMTCSP